MPPPHRPLRLPSRTARAQAERKILWNEARTADGANFYTIGYAGRSATDIIELLQSAGVRTLVDIRYNPISMYKPELSKTNLRQTVIAAGLHYLHVPQWGVPRNVRAKAMETGNRQIIWEWYDANVVERL